MKLKMVSDIKKLRNNVRILSDLDLIKTKEFKIGVIELHLTQKCNLKYFHCSYGKIKCFQEIKIRKKNFL